MNISFTITKAARGLPHFRQLSVCPAECSSLVKSSLRCFKKHTTHTHNTHKNLKMHKKPKSVSPFGAHSEQSFKGNTIFSSPSAICRTPSLSLCAHRALFVHKAKHKSQTAKCLLVRVNQLPFHCYKQQQATASNFAATLENASKQHETWNANLSGL